MASAPGTGGLPQRSLMMKQDSSHTGLKLKYQSVDDHEPLGLPDIPIPSTYLLTPAPPSQTALEVLVKDIGFRQDNVMLTLVHLVNF